MAQSYLSLCLQKHYLQFADSSTHSSGCRAPARPRRQSAAALATPEPCHGLADRAADDQLGDRPLDAASDHRNDDRTNRQSRDCYSHREILRNDAARLTFLQQAEIWSQQLTMLVGWVELKKKKTMTMIVMTVR